jgi:hypothetical protein
VMRRCSGRDGPVGVDVFLTSADNYLS